MAAKSTGKRSTRTAPADRVSMREVAAGAGVSRSAVSLALQGHPSIPVSTRERILRVVDRLGYRKNPLVAALMSTRRAGAGRTTSLTSLAFLTSHVPPDSWRQAATHRRFHAAACARAMELGFSLDEFSLGAPDMRPERLEALLRARGIHGVLVAPLPGEQTRLNFDLTRFATVGLGMSVKEPGIDRVSDDHFFAGQLAFDSCLALGYRRIGLALAADVSRRLEHRWWSGFLVAQQQVPARDRVRALMPETRDEIPPALNAWIAKNQLDAVVFSIRNQELMGTAPAHVGLVSLSVHDATGKVAGVRQNERGVGEDAIDLLVAKLHRWSTGTTDAPRLTLVRGEWSAGLSAPGAGRPRRALV
jgi:LacI family transcriptional regulator